MSSICEHKCPVFADSTVAFIFFVPPRMILTVLMQEVINSLSQQNRRGSCGCLLVTLTSQGLGLCQLFAWAPGSSGISELSEKLFIKGPPHALFLLPRHLTVAAAAVGWIEKDQRGGTSDFLPMNCNHPGFLEYSRCVCVCVRERVCVCVSAQKPKKQIIQIILNIQEPFSVSFLLVLLPPGDKPLPPLQCLSSGEAGIGNPGPHS